jgi:hypothetical protein
VTQQARNMVYDLQDRDRPMRYLIHDRDTKFFASFNTVFRSEGIHVILIPPRAPNANAFAERWVRTVWEECLDHILILNDKHLLRVLKEFSVYHNSARPHQGLDQRIPLAYAMPTTNKVLVRHRTVLGGIINDYYRAAA